MHRNLMVLRYSRKAFILPCPLESIFNKVSYMIKQITQDFKLYKFYSAQPCATELSSGSIANFEVL